MEKTLKTYELKELLQLHKFLKRQDTKISIGRIRNYLKLKSDSEARGVCQKYRMYNYLIDNKTFLVADSNGYWLSSDNQEISRYCKMLVSRNRNTQAQIEEANRILGGQ